MKHTFRRLSVVGLTAAAVVAGGAGLASAHVTARAPDARQGSYAEITFQVPTESDTASTVELQAQLPKDTPISSVSTKPVPGWTASTQKTHLDQPITTDDGDKITDVVSTITWKADPGQGIAPGQYQTFSISAGPLPRTGSLTFPTIQTYSDGKQVAWIEPQPAGQPAPEHPAPTITLADAQAQQAGGQQSAGTTTTPSSSSGSSGVTVTALVLGIAALLAAVAALAAALRNRRTAPTDPAGSERVGASAAH